VLGREVVGVSILDERRDRAERLALWAWTTIGLTPVGLGLSWVMVVLVGEGTEGLFFQVLNAALLLGLALTAPTAAVALAVAAARDGHPTGRLAVVVAVTLLVVTLLGLAVLVTGVSLPWLLAVAAVAAVLGWGEWRHRHPAPD
jgi:hypothetical protein